MSASSSTNDLRNRIIFTILILAVYRFGTFVPLPGIDPEQLKIMMEGNQKGLLGMFNVFAGGAVSRMAIFALGIMPYISSAIIVQLLTGVTDYFKNLKAQGETGRAKITQITRYGTVLLATVQGYGLSVGLESSADLVINPGAFFKITTVTTIVAGTIFLMWLGEQITQRGIGNGISLIIFAGIVAEIPRALVTTFELGRTGAVSTFMILAIFVLLIVTILFVVFMERALRKIIRSKLFINLYGMLHPRIGYAIGNFVSKKGGNYLHSAERNKKISDEMSIHAKKKIDQGFDYFISGHYHQAEDRKLNDGNMIILGDWLSFFTYAKYDGSEIKLHKWLEN